MRVTAGTILILSFLPGCTTLADRAPDLLPSLAYCDKVAYNREGNAVKVTADCRAPVK